MKEKKRDGDRGGSHQPVYSLPCLPDIRPLYKIDFLHHLCHIVRICTVSPSEPSRKWAGGKWESVVVLKPLLVRYLGLNPSLDEGALSMSLKANLRPQQLKGNLAQNSTASYPWDPLFQSQLFCCNSQNASDKWCWLAYAWSFTLPSLEVHTTSHLFLLAEGTEICPQF